MNILSAKTAKTLILLLVTLLFLLACALPGIPSQVTTNPTSAPGLVQTIVVETAGAAQTQTALVLPSLADTATATLPPSSTPTETPTPTATVIFIIPTITNSPTATSLPTSTNEPGSQAGDSCELVSQSPANDKVYDSRERFTAQWTIKNTGSETWVADNLDFFYSGGRDMHEADIIDLPRNVRAGGQITLEVDMRAPGKAGTYTSTWTLGTKNNSLCVVSVRIKVQ